jgi:hypothetical protein
LKLFVGDSFDAAIERTGGESVVVPPNPRGQRVLGIESAIDGDKHELFYTPGVSDLQVS